MGQITATRRLHFSSGHRVYGHETKCKNLHGHNYVVFLHARTKVYSQQNEGSKSLDSLGRVVDFGVLKEKFDPWIQDNWDHGTLLWITDPLRHAWHDDERFIGQKLYLSDWNPTAECMANHLLNISKDLLGPDSLVEVFKVVLWETENCFAEVVL